MLNLLFPKVCNGCKAILIKSENVICTKCIHNLPLICHHRTGNQAMKDVFYGRFHVQNATSLLQFQKKGITQEIMHNLKYRGRKEISYFFGKWLGEELKTIDDYHEIDVVIPVPLHKKKMKTRGYNQVEGFGREIAKALNIPYYDDVLIKITNTNSQVFKRRLTRFTSSEGNTEVFSVVNSEKINDKHILIVDDIVTTGATFEKCATQLLKNSNIRISVATIALT
tara:strand:- start:60 stop:734 length:675 start_codon:yes stop_codon:yes gene_type:complete